MSNSKNIRVLETKKKLLTAKLKLAEANKSRKQRIETDMISEARRLLEMDLEKAEVVLAMQSIVDEVQKMTERTAKMQIEEILPITDRIRNEIGNEQAEHFEKKAEEAFGSVVDSLKSARETLSKTIAVAEGKMEPGMDNDMASDDGSDENLDDMLDDMSSDDTSDVDAALDDIVDQEPEERVKKESIEHAPKKKV